MNEPRAMNDLAAPAAMLDFGDLRHYDWLHLPVWVFALDPPGIRWANAAALDFWRADDLAALTGRDYSDLSPPARARLADSMQRHAQGQLVREPWTLYPLDEPITTVLLSRGIRLPDGQQAILFASEPLAASYDPTVLRGIEAMRHTPVRVALHRADGGPAVMRNPAALEAFGPVDAEGGRFGELFADEALAAGIVATVRAGRSFAGEALLRTTQGERWHSVDARAVRDPVTGAAMLQFNAREISDLKSALAALEAARDAAEAASRAKSSFLANISHELHTPLNGMLGLTRMLLGTTLDERQRRQLTMVLESTEGLARLIDDVLDLTRLDADRLTLAPAPMSLAETLQQVLAPLQLQALQRGLRLEWQLDAEVPDTIVADAPRWRQILLNLVGNALKFTEHGGVQLRVRRAQGDAHQALLVLSVQDSGIGMTPEQLAIVFEPFTQGEDGLTRRHGGSGLGLTLVQRLVRLMGGRVEVDSRPGEGSCFRVIVPVGLLPPTAPPAGG